MLRSVDLVVDRCDSHTTRYDISTTAVALGVPVVYDLIVRWEGVETVFSCRGGPCSRCLFPVQPELSFFATTNSLRRRSNLRRDWLAPGDGSGQRPGSV